MPSEKQISRFTIKGWDDDHIEYEDDEGKYVLYSDHVAALTAAEQAEPAPSARSGAVKVKALEWKDERNCECSAETVIGTYEVGFDDGWWAQLEGGVKWDWNPPYDPRSYEGPSAAKAAAQADYERRILAALEPAEPSGFLATLSEDQKEAARNYTGPDTEPAADVEAVAWLYDWVDDDGETQTEASTNRISSVNFKPTSNVRPLFTRPPESRLREALEPFAKYLDTAKFDVDYNGNPLPDEQGMGWVYLTIGDFRRARTALAQGADDGRS